jgi:hypothetical protein
MSENTKGILYPVLFVSFCIVLCISAMALNARSQKETFQGKISDVRITFSQTVKKFPGGDPISGGIIGGLIAGKTGAIVGAISEGSKQASSGTAVQVVACGFTVEADNHKLTYAIAGESVLGTQFEEANLNRCSLLRDGDVIDVRKTMDSGTEDYSIWKNTVSADSIQ